MDYRNSDEPSAVLPRLGLSAILWTPDCYDTIRRTVQALRRQTVPDRIELILLGPTSDALTGATSDMAGFGAHQMLVVGPIAKSSEVRATGIRAARAPVVAFMQDHCFPAPRWAEALITRHQGPWAGVGFVFNNDNPSTATSWVNFLLQYGEWADPPPAGPPRHIGGHNGSYKRDVLLFYGDELPRLLEHSSTMQWDLMLHGHRFTLDPEAKASHQNHSRLFPSVKLRFYAGRLFAARRAVLWPVWRRFVYALAWPAIAAVRFARLTRAAVRVGEQRRLPRLVPVSVLLLVCDGVGQAVGYLAGGGNAMEFITTQEYHRHRFMVDGEG
jgi:hypothetical protein